MHPAIRSILCACIAAALLTPGVSAFAMPAPVPMEQALILHVDGTLTIDAQGVPTDYLIKTKLRQDVSDILQRQVRAWRFQPVMVGGKQVIAKTQMRVTLTAQDEGADSRLSVDNVTFPEIHGVVADTEAHPDGAVSISFAKATPPEYPQEALAYGVEADALLYLLVTPDGKVAQSCVTQIALLNVKGSPRNLSAAANIFERAVLDTAKKWRFNVVVHDSPFAKLSSTTSTDAGTASIFTIRVPVMFRFGTKTDTTSKWQQEMRTAKRAVPWLSPELNAASVGVADIDTANSDPTPVASNFHLNTQVIGTTL